MKNKVSISLVIILCACVSATAQVATGGTYSLDQAVIAGGGGQNSAGGTFSVDGTIGQSIAGTTSTNSPFAVQGGFWTAAPMAPTAAGVTISGRVLAANDRVLRNARVTITDQRGESRNTLTTGFGYFYFADAAAGETYIFTVQSKRFVFAPQVLFVSDNITELIFNAVSPHQFNQKDK